MFFAKFFFNICFLYNVVVVFECFSIHFNILKYKAKSHSNKRKKNNNACMNVDYYIKAN